MRKIVLVACVLFGIMVNAQEAKKYDFGRNELKGNALALVFGSFNVSYERILSEESAVGVAVNLPFDNKNWDINYTLTGYYRYYFGKKPAAGFFGEAFGMLNNVDDYVYNDGTNYYELKTLTDFALGIGLGGKWVTKKGLLLEINGGLGRNLFNNQYDDRDFELIGRLGISVGYRF
ncbi:MAG: DUF3575 domain-containing protein [Flavobacterium sp.]|nr:DUF3575 domain-containing protein [Flavobacterium sp.]